MFEPIPPISEEPPEMVLLRSISNRVADIEKRLVNLETFEKNSVRDLKRYRKQRELKDEEVLDTNQKIVTAIEKKEGTWLKEFAKFVLYVVTALLVYWLQHRLVP